MPQLHFDPKALRKRISGINWRFRLFDAFIFSLWTPFLFGTVFLLGLGEFSLIEVAGFWLLNAGIIACVYIVAIVVVGPIKGKSIAINMFTSLKLKLGWGKFCVIQKSEIENEEWTHYRVKEMRKRKKVYYDDPQKAAMAIWVSGFHSFTEDLNQLFTLFIKGRKYALPRMKTITVSAIAAHIEHCLEIDKSFYD